MSLKFALAGLAALAGIASAGSASAAMPNALSQAASPSAVENVRIVCDVYGRCWRRPSVYYGPRFYGGYGYGRPRFYGGYGYGPRFHGGWRRW